MAEPPQPHGFHEWSVPGSNRRPSACKADALPTELTPRACQSVGEGQERLAKYRPMTGFCLFAQSDGLRAEARDAPRQRSEQRKGTHYRSENRSDTHPGDCMPLAKGEVGLRRAAANSASG